MERVAHFNLGTLRYATLEGQYAVCYPTEITGWQESTGRKRVHATVSFDNGRQKSASASDPDRVC